MLKSISRFIATGTYTGYTPRMPGTAGTLWGVVIVYMCSALSVRVQAQILLAAFVVSVITAEITSRELRSKDPKEIVCDEVVGYLVTFVLVPLSALNLILAFLFFRFFDILKPYPVNAIDKKVRGGLGIVLDDVAAGIYANIATHLIIWFTGGQLLPLIR